MSEIEKLVYDVWNKGKTIQGFDPQKYRQDAAGAWIKFDQYIPRNKIKDDFNVKEAEPFAWVIDHIFPKKLLVKNNVDLELTECIENLRPLHIKNDISKGDDYPEYKAVIRAEQNRNIEEETYFTISEATQNKLKKIFKL